MSAEGVDSNPLLGTFVDTPTVTRRFGKKLSVCPNARTVRDAWSRFSLVGDQGGTHAKADYR